MKVIFLSSQGYKDSGENKGDCILIDTNSELVIYDCGCEEHANRAIDYMDKHHYSKAKLVLSHNDADHFDGIPHLIEAGKISDVYTLLLLKYKDDLLEKINDKRITRDSLARRISEIFANIYSLSGKVVLKDIFSDTFICNEISIIGPDREYALDAVAKRIDNRQGDTIDKETIVNAVSTQVKVIVGTKNLLLCGDSSYEAIKNKLPGFNLIQLPHHGKKEQADRIFEQKGSVGITYYVSDNTGNSNGGSDDLPVQGYNIKNTLKGDQECSSNSVGLINAPVRSYYRGN
ncbi:MBL fold metallo-hydrolase [Blautia wexlerae]|uniref:MBL fold metallo-hydrolase n=1 Tax=Blautia wexlerae TaxID=418240 RepID=UPI00157095DA|nr:MBL fold metallo-hydrolase [Blautia wexlerae]NSE04717.1 MBL fold metallo-hydrolase [Blautia wexlerae]NSF78366.1 MBL fold metallo-hydrolase [Blautia wexlerae]